ncbi:DUF2817 domain-containing protein [Sansalvadorimonas sp. 2012CJ34-2]|uniref:DUF2817 domain-containing protein n=1 Tax=Parendozoicomonas callyspongiae TaxID=2942213 RepID=A0ABT0PLD7_9GAMM|nr:DUF2817 domain-containing protein [Sansalvadorimonas sp. 2012CJ34-2]MCL6271796.1 DUF2817 domain-containing protein [Sansalvadorimonas sp. 2012CJ34-2]
MNLIPLQEGLSAGKRPIPVFASKVDATRYCYLIAGTHGDEPEGVYVQEKLVEWLKLAGLSIPFVIIPALNPDGLRDNIRGNGNGVDLNRNLPASNWSDEARAERYFPGSEPASEPETQFLLELMEEYPPGLIFSFHSWQPFVNGRGDCDDILEYIHLVNGYAIVKDDIDNHPTPGSLGSYVYEKMGIPIITFECPTLEQREDLQSIWHENKIALTGLMQSGLIQKHLQRYSG